MSLVSHRDRRVRGRHCCSVYGWPSALSQLPGYLGGTGDCGRRRWLAPMCSQYQRRAEYGPLVLVISHPRRHATRWPEISARGPPSHDRGLTTPGTSARSEPAPGGLLRAHADPVSRALGALVCRQPLLACAGSPCWAGAAVIASTATTTIRRLEFMKEYCPTTTFRGPCLPADPDHTSTSDDRVQARHARKMAAALPSAGHRVVFYENTAGGPLSVSNARPRFQTH